MKDYKRLTERYVEEKGDFFKKGTRFTLKNAPDGEILERLAELEDKIEDGTLVELPCKCIEELDIIKDRMIFIFYKMCLEQNLGQGIFLKYKSKINEWFKSYLKTKDCRKKGNERVQEINKQ